MPVNAVRTATEMPVPKSPNIHDILMKIDSMMDDANMQVERIHDFLTCPDHMELTANEPCGPNDMLSHVMHISDQVVKLHDQIYDISLILGMV